MKLPAILLSVLFLTALVISGIAGWFYWFQWRPNEARKVCSEEAIRKAVEGTPYLSLLPDGDKILSEKANSYYGECLAKRGQKPEPLVGK